MVSRSSSFLILALGGILAVALPAHGGVFVENFDDGTVDSEFLVLSSTVGYQSIIQQETLLVQKFPGASGVGRASLTSTFQVLGDFSVTTSVDPTGLSGDPILALGVAVASEAGFANIFFKGGGSPKPVFANLFIGPGFPATGTALPSAVRVFRILRTGNTLALQFHDGVSFVTLNSATHPDLAGPLTVELFLLTEGGSNTAGSVGRFDDLVIEAGAFSFDGTGSPTPSINLGSISTFAGNTAILDVSLKTAGVSLAGLQNDILLPPGVSIVSTANGRPDCRVNPSIDKSATAFSFRPPGCNGANCTGVLALVVSTTNVDDLADGTQLYSCRLQISASAPPGPLTLGCANEVGSTPDGTSVAMDCYSATLVVANPTDPSVWLNSPTALPGAEVAISAILENGGSGSVGGLDLELSLPLGVEVLPNSNGGPDCTLAPGVGTAAAGLAFRPSGCSPEGVCTGVRLIAVNFLPISEGHLFTCRAMVQTEAPPGSSPLGCSLNLGDPLGNAIPGNCLNGRLTIADPELPRLVIGSASGDLGGEVMVDIGLETRGASVATAQVDLLFTPGLSVAALPGGSPDCELSPGLDKQALFGFLPFGCSPGANCRGVLLVAVDTSPPVTAMPDLPGLFRCRLELTADVAPGAHPLDCQDHQLGTPLGDEIESRCTSGIVQVRERAPLCFADCDQNGSVTAGDITRIAATILHCNQNPGGCAEVPGGCPAADRDFNGLIGFNEFKQAIQINLVEDPDWCPAGPTPTPVPDTVLCGDGVVAGGEECDDGNNYGGDGCAANCTFEQDLTLDISTGVSHAVLQVATFPVTLPIAGSEVITVGSPRAETVFGADGKTTFAPGQMPTVNLLAKNNRIEPIAIPGLACVCPRGVVLQTCGGVVPTPGETSQICNTGSLGAINPAVCNGQAPCAPAFGPGSIAGGRIGCNGISDLNYALHSNSLTGETSFGRFGGAVQTGMISIGYSAFGVIQGSCATDISNPGKGPDGVPCTDDDPPSTRGVAELRVQTTGIASASVLNVNDQNGNHIDEDSFCGTDPCSTAAVGTAATCADLLAHDAFMCLATANAVLDQSALGDAVFTMHVCGTIQ